jgi:hypothetical protein
MQGYSGDPDDGIDGKLLTDERQGEVDAGTGKGIEEGPDGYHTEDQGT